MNQNTNLAMLAEPNEEIDLMTKLLALLKQQLELDKKLEALVTITEE